MRVQKDNTVVADWARISLPSLLIFLWALNRNSVFTSEQNSNSTRWPVWLYDSVWFSMNRADDKYASALMLKIKKENSYLSCCTNIPSPFGNEKACQCRNYCGSSQHTCSKHEIRTQNCYKQCTGISVTVGIAGLTLLSFTSMSLCTVEITMYIARTGLEAATCN